MLLALLLPIVLALILALDLGLMRMRRMGRMSSRRSDESKTDVCHFSSPSLPGVAGSRYLCPPFLSFICWLPPVVDRMDVSLVFQSNPIPLLFYYLFPVCVFPVTCLVFSSLVSLVVTSRFSIPSLREKM